MAATTGVVFPEHDGTRSTSATGRSVVASALREVDQVGARSAEQETNWRHGYLTHYRRLVEAGILSPYSERTIAAEGLAALHREMEFVGIGGTSRLADALEEQTPQHAIDTAEVTGTGRPDRELSIPYRGDRLRGDALLRRLDAWVGEGVMEPSTSEAVRAVVANPDWLDLSDQTMVVLGAGAEMGPLQSVLRWGGTAVALDLPRPDIWGRVLPMAEAHAGRLLVPVVEGAGSGDLADRAGADLLHDLPAVAAWLGDVPGRLVLGNYVYADGATNVRVSMAVDALTVDLQLRRPDTALAFLATPTDVFAVPADAVEASGEAYGRRGFSRTIRPAARLVSGGRLLRRNYAPDADPGICDSLVAQQGPNYVLAKRLQRWRATTARASGSTVSLNVAPPTRTRSVLKNRALAAAYAGAHRFGVEVFDPSTSNTLMAALLVHDLRAPSPPREHPWEDEVHGATHGGLWRIAYAPRSALGLAVVLGLGGARG